MRLPSGDGFRGGAVEVDGYELLILPVEAVFVVASAKLAPGVAAPESMQYI